MAETAKILNPTKTVLLPTEKGGCSLAESITAADVRALRAAYPGVPIVTYINTYADVKAECDICCTSSNAAAVVESLKSDTVIFLPDEYLARNVARETGRHVIVPSVLPQGAGAGKATTPTSSTSMIAWKGRCEVHELFTPEDVDVRAQAVPGRDDPRASRMQPRSGREGGFLRQHDGDDQGRREVEREALPAAHRMLDGRQHRRRESGQGNAAPLQPPLPAHARDHARADARLAALHALGDRRAGGHPRARAALPSSACWPSGRRSIERADPQRRPGPRLRHRRRHGGARARRGRVSTSLIVTRADRAGESNTYWAQGGIIFRGDERLARTAGAGHRQCRRRPLPRAGGPHACAARARRWCSRS